MLTQQITADLDGADMYSVMAVLATACNFNPVIFLKYPPNYYFKGLGITNESENVSRRATNANLTGTCAPHALADILTIDTYYASKFAKLAGLLDGITNADGSTLPRQHGHGLAQPLFRRPGDEHEQPPNRPGGRLRRLLQDWLDRERRHPKHGFAHPEPREQRGAMSARNTGGMFNGLTKGTGTDPSSPTRRSTNTTTT